MRSAVIQWRQRVAEQAAARAESRRWRTASPRLGTRYNTRRDRIRPVGRLVTAALAILLSLALIVATAGLDSYLHRGVVFGSPAPATAPATGGPLLGMNVFLEKEADREHVVTTVKMLKQANVTFVRQTFSWAEIESQPGVYRDVNSGQDSWAKYDFIVEQLHSAGIGILARIDTIPRWARPPDDDFARWDKAPPQDFNNYANFVATVATRYKGKIRHFQVWNEPNLEGEWGGKPISPEQYGLLLKFTYLKVKAANPDALIVTAGLAQTVEDAVTTNNMSELQFIQGLYDSGAQDYFDILSVMAYGLGASPEDRRIDAERTNLSRIVLAREIMVRNGDAAKPIWVSEYGWVALPPDWQGGRSTWGESVSEDTQARYLVGGLERARIEWPWLGAVFVWAFRWVEPPEARPNDPVRYFEVVSHDFTPRPAFVALSQWSQKQAIATAGPLEADDARLEWTGSWRVQELAGREYRVATGEGAIVRLAFHGTTVRLRARTGPSAGRVYVTIDGQPIPGLRSDERGSYIPLRDTQVNDAELIIASRLTDTDHLLEVRGGESGEVALTGFTIGRQQPFAWTVPTLFALGLGGLFAGLALALRTVATVIGWLPVARYAPPARRYLAWWDTRE